MRLLQLLHKEKVAVVSLLSLGTLLFAPLHAEPEYTVVLKGGRTVTATPVNVNCIYKYVTVSNNGKEEHFAFNVVKSIHDSSGIELKDQLLKEDCSNKQVKSARDSKSARTARLSTPWGIRLSLGTVYTVPFEDYYSQLKPAFGGVAEFNLAVSRPISLKFTYKNDAMNLEARSLSLPLDASSVKTEVNTLRFAFAVEWSLMPKGVKNGTIVPYINSGTGLISQDMSFQFVTLWQGRPVTNYGHSSEDKLFSSIGVGGLIFLTRYLAFDVGMNYELVLIGERENFGHLLSLTILVSSIF